MSTLPKYINEGSYGCVHRPALRCTAESQGLRHINYGRSVSKLGKANHMKREMNEFEIIDEIDTEFQYHLRENFICDPDITDENRSAILNCGIGKNVVKSPEDYKIVIQKYGGMDLDKVARIFYNSKKENKEHRQAAMNFWRACPRLFKGIEFFVEHGVVHHDIKRGNILYDISTNRLNFIDFGMMEYIKESIQECKNDDYGLAVTHAYYPLESVLLNRPEFHDLKTRLEGASASAVVDAFIQRHTAQYPQRKWFGELEIMLKNHNGGLSAAEWTAYRTARLDEFRRFLGQLPGLDYEDFLRTYFAKFDTYCLGLTLRVMLHASAHLMDSQTVDRIRALTDAMIHFDLMERLTAEESADRFDQIMALAGTRTMDTYYGRRGGGGGRRTRRKRKKTSRIIL